MALYIPFFPDHLTLALTRKLLQSTKGNIYFTEEKLAEIPSSQTDISPISLGTEFPDRLLKVSNNALTKEPLTTVLLAFNPSRLATPNNPFAQHVLQRIKELSFIFKNNKNVRILLLSSWGSYQNRIKTSDNPFYEMEKQIINTLCPFTILRTDLVVGFETDFMKFLETIHNYSPFYPSLGNAHTFFHPINLDQLVKKIIQVHDEKLFEDQILHLSGSSYSYRELLSHVASVAEKPQKKWNVPNLFQPYLIKKITSHCHNNGVPTEYFDYVDNFVSDASNMPTHLTSEEGNAFKSPN